MARSYSKRRTRKQRGGDLAGNPASAWGWGLGTVGDGMTQIMNSLTLQPGQNTATAQSNNLVPIGNINASNPASSMLQPNMGGGLDEDEDEEVEVNEVEVNEVEVEIGQQC